MFTRKIYVLCALVICVLSLDLSPIAAQDTSTPLHGVQAIDETQVSDGYVLFTPAASTTVYLIDNTGAVVNQWESKRPSRHAYLMENGDLIVPLPAAEGSDGGGVERYTWDGDIVWSYFLPDETLTLHHDIEPLDNGNLLITVWETLTHDEALALGLDPTNITQVENTDNTLRYDIIQEINPLTGEIVWEWRFLDNIVQNYDETLPNYGIPAAEPTLIDLNFDWSSTQNSSRTHINAITYHPDENIIMVSSRFYSEIWWIDRTTGTLVYRWGNPAAFGRGTPEAQQLFAQHDARWLDNDHVLIFNNGDSDVRPYSTVIEIVPPERNADGSFPLLVGSTYEPAAPVWEYRADPPERMFARVMSGAHRTANGNTFITLARAGELLEVTPEGETVWHYINPIFTAPTDEDSLPATIFRATRYPSDYSAFAGRTLTPGDAIPYTVLEVGT